MRTLIFTIILFFFSRNNCPSQDLVTVNQYYFKADSLAKILLRDPHLLEISTNLVDEKGKSECWIFGYDSLAITINSDTVTIDTSFHWWTGMAEVTGDWMNSDSAIAIAEKGGGSEFRLNNHDVRTSALLFKSSAAIHPEWEIRYWSETNPGVGFRIIFNAYDGSDVYEYYSIVEKKSKKPFFRLYQNYPNPFNASTEISFKLPTRSNVTLNIFDATGRKIYSNSGMLRSGLNKIAWQPKNIASGLYFYEIIYNGFCHKKSLIYIK